MSEPFLLDVKENKGENHIMTALKIMALRLFNYAFFIGIFVFFIGLFVSCLYFNSINMCIVTLSLYMLCCVGFVFTLLGKKMFETDSTLLSSK